MVRRKYVGFLFCLFVVISSFSNVFAQEANEQESGSAMKLGQVVVTATKTEKKIEDVPGSVTVIDQVELKKQNVQTVDDALNNIPGVYVKRTKGLMESTPSVRMRGFNGDQYTLVLLDGQPLNNAYGGDVEWGSLAVGNIERIEVIRGTASLSTLLPKPLKNLGSRQAPGTVLMIPSVIGSALETACGTN